ncbi:MAG TPA: SBBP repeat-containing protein [Candidatus Sulfotelmatobacter sp.]|nr:SBBP repeat-containing protein [Candidatus Sulfotelmatobacter sp.]
MKVDQRRRQSVQKPFLILCTEILLIATGAALIGLSSASHPGLRSASALLPPSIFPPARAAQSTFAQQQALHAWNALPLRFEPNVGQSDSQVKFIARGAGYGLFLSSDRAVIALRSKASSQGKDIVTDVLSMRLVGASRHATVSGISPLPGKTNYFFGNDPAKWHHDVPQFARVKYENVYPATDLVFYGNPGQLEYDFRIAPGGDPARDELEFTGAAKIELQNGSLLLKGRAGVVRFGAPRIYQEISGHRQPIEGRFVMRSANRVGFEVGSYDHSRELVIDPDLTYGTYFGGTGDETLPSIAVDNEGNIYLAGTTTSNPSTFPVPATQTLIPPASHVFVAKISTSLSAPIYETFLGGSVSEKNVGLGVDGGGNAYIAGTTSSADFPTTATNAYQPTPEAGSKGTSHIYVTQLDANGCLIGCVSQASTYSSYLSGNNTDVATGMTIDNKGNMYVTGTTTSTDVGGSAVGGSIIEFPASAPPEAEPFQPTSRNGAIQFFVTKVDTQAFGIGSIIYSTYFGGAVPSSPIATGGGVAVDNTGNIYFSGTTNFVFTGQSGATDFPILNAYQPCLDTAPPTVITNPQTCTGTPATAPDAFVAKINPTAPQGTQLIWSTYFGGSANDSGVAVAVDPGGANVYLTGVTNSTNFTFPTSAGVFQRCLGNAFNGSPTTCGTAPATNDAYVARFTNPTTGNVGLGYFTYIGGSQDESALALTVDTTNDALITGWTQSPNNGYPVIPPAVPTQANSGGFPVTPGAIETALTSTSTPPQNAFFARINTAAATGQNVVGTFLTYYGGSGTDRGSGIAIDSSLNTFIAGDTTSPAPTLPIAGSSVQKSLAGGLDAFAAELGTAAAISISGQLPNNQQVFSAGNQVTFTYTITNTGPDVATDLAVTDNLSISGPTGTGIPVTLNSATASPGSCSQSSTSNSIVACTIGNLQNGSTATVKITVTPTTGGNFNGGTVQVIGTNNIVLAKASVHAEASDFTVDIQPKAAPVTAGASVNYTVVISPVPVYGSAVSLTVGQLPVGATANFSQNSVTPGNSPVSSTLTISTTARPIPIARSRMSTMIYALWLGIPGMALIWSGKNPSRRRRLIGIWLTCLLFGLLAFQPACSSNGTTTPPATGTPAATYGLTLTATSGTLTHNQTFSLTVN